MIRWIGAALLVGGCGGFGIALGAAARREIGMLRGLAAALQEMEWELKYRMTELPGLCTLAAEASRGDLRRFFGELAQKLERREVTDISGCVNGLLWQRDFPRRVSRLLGQLGHCLGRFDLEGQLEGLQQVRANCLRELEGLSDTGIQHLRCYQTLLLCGGAALAILFI